MTGTNPPSLLQQLLVTLSLLLLAVGMASRHPHAAKALSLAASLTAVAALVLLCIPPSE